MEWTRTSRYAWTSNTGYTIAACRVPERDDMPSNARRAKPASESYLDQLVPLYWHYTLWSPVDDQVIAASFDPAELRAEAETHERARAFGGHG